MPEAVAYCRVSTARQGASGLGLDAQQAAVQAHCQRRRLEIIHSFTEDETGAGKRQGTEILRAIDASRKLGAALAISEHEAGLISKRAKEALAVARAREL